MSEDNKVQGTVMRLDDRRVILAPLYEDSCSQHGPWQVKFKRLFDEAGEVANTGTREITRKVLDKYFSEVRICLSNDALRALAFLYLRRQSIKDVETLMETLVNIKDVCVEDEPVEKRSKTAGSGLDDTLRREDVRPGQSWRDNGNVYTVLSGENGFMLANLTTGELEDHTAYPSLEELTECMEFQEQGEDL